MQEFFSPSQLGTEVVLLFVMLLMILCAPRNKVFCLLQSCRRPALLMGAQQAELTPKAPPCGFFFCWFFCQVRGNESALQTYTQ